MTRWNHPPHKRLACNNDVFVMPWTDLIDFELNIITRGVPVTQGVGCYTRHRLRLVTRIRTVRKFNVAGRRLAKVRTTHSRLAHR